MSPNSKEKNERRLIYFPIIHRPEDLGKFEETVRKAILKKGGALSLRQKAIFIDRLWSDIERAIDAMELDFPNTRIFQDALPVCGKEEIIVEDLAAKGNRNHKLLLKLSKKGAVLQGTESPELLLLEYENIKKQLLESAPNGGSGLEPSRERAEDEILERRDRFIADRIDRVLKAGETGIVFLGMLHDLERFLPSDITAVYPLYRPIPRV